MKKSKKKPAKAKKKPVKKANSKKSTPVKAKKKSAKKSAPVAKKKTARTATAVLKNKSVKKVIAKKPITKAIDKKLTAKKPSPKVKSTPRPQLNMDFDTVQAPETVTSLPEDGPFMDSLGEDLMNEAIEDTEDNMERDADDEIQGEDKNDN